MFSLGKKLWWFLWEKKMWCSWDGRTFEKKIERFQKGQSGSVLGIQVWSDHRAAHLDECAGLDS